MRIPALFAALLLTLGTSLLPAQDDTSKDAPALFPEGYLDHDGLSAALKAAAEAHPELVSVRALAQSGEGRDVWMVRMGRPEREGDATRAAILLVANLEADHVVGSQVALELIRRLAAADGKDDAVTALFDRHTLYLVPRLNPDGAERVLKGQPRVELRTNLRPVDRDRDRKAGEDGPDDLDADGLATRMRVQDDKATLLADPKDPRISRKADPAKGERAEFSEYAEGKDDDGDGPINEDPAGGINLNRNWPHRWAEFDAETGYSPASEPEVRALISWAFAHPEVAAIYSYSLNDSLKAEPRKPGSTLDDADLPYFAELSRLHGKAEAPAKSEEPKKDEAPAEPEAKKEEPKADEPTKPAEPPRGRRGGGRPPTPTTPPTPAAGVGLDGTTDGALSEWAYHQFGVVGIAARLWPGPDLSEPAKGEPAPPGDGEARWLYWNDKVMGGRAFVPFHDVDHPTLGKKVQVGGWKPGVRLNPPSGRVAAIADAEFAFLKELGAKLAALKVEDLKVEPKGGGLFEIKATVVNDGDFPTALAQGVRTRKAPPVLVRLRAGEAKLLVGKPLDRIESLAGSGGRKEYRWLLLAPEGTKTATLEVSCPKAGRVVREVTLPRP